MSENKIISNANELIAQKEEQIKQCNIMIDKFSFDAFMQFGYIKRKEELESEIEALKLIDDSIHKAFDKFNTDVQNTIKKSSPK